MGTVNTGNIQLFLSGNVCVFVGCGGEGSGRSPLHQADPVAGLPTGAGCGC